ncbi:TonB-dependent receptor [Ponticaulis sp.]|uniref:TonB-dependent receptor n=1 Tax=Ponticaulis sp. TaxID=2020902 RepID=UPI000B697BEE|nr:TonB-dependent receptor [Ponticaulis sp.]MAI90009.1 hypothetical protein [Ponticaulis sp.]OUX99670.1 MAG: hypothetical protein CBB65_06170 [Hyphomonadaceae bacterium TMED5]
MIDKADKIAASSARGRGSAQLKSIFLSGTSLALLTTGLTGVAAAQEEATYQLSTVTVTAQKRTEDMQDVPVSVTALDAQSLNDLNVNSFEDYVRLLPGVSSAGNGPGQSAFFIRGMATNLGDIGTAEIAGTSPNVALYLDEQPISTISRNLDIYVTDMERVEVLPGPQGTLFGASSQAGTIRLITNKPELDTFDAGMDLGYAMTHGGQSSNSVEGFVNIPLIEGRLAVRITAYNAFEGGYIDNNQASLTFPETNAGLSAGGFLSALNSRIQAGDVSFVSRSNTDLAGEDINDATYSGGRIGLKYQINDDWSALVQYQTQRLETEGVFADDVSSSGDGIITDEVNGAGEYAVSRYVPEFLDDEFERTSLTVEGRVGMLDVIYSGAYLDRDVEQTYDYAGYIQDGAFVAYYICDYYGAYYADVSPVCHDPTYGANMAVNFTRQTHELRVSTPEEYNLRFIGGVYYDDAVSKSDIQFFQPGLFEYVADYSAADGVPPYWASFFAAGTVPQLVPPTDATLYNSNPRPEGVTFYNDVTRSEEQIAVFGELSYDLIPDTLTVTGGLRHYSMDVSLGGVTQYIFGTVNIDSALAGESPANQTDTILKGNITWRPTDDMMFYLTYSEGFRPGGFNRNGGSGGVPFSYESDEVQNYELGWKITALNNRLRFNGSIYQIDWSNLQLSIQDISVSQLTFVDNVGEASILGSEGSVAFAATPELTLSAAYSYNDTELSSLPGSIVNLAPVGSSLAYTPEFQGNIMARYERSLTSEYDGYVQGAIQYSDESYNSIVLADRVLIDSWTNVDVSAGISTDKWAASLYVENLTDERIVRSVQTSDPRNLEYVSRPRTIGARLSVRY